MDRLGQSETGVEHQPKHHPITLSGEVTGVGLGEKRLLLCCSEDFRDLSPHVGLLQESVFLLLYGLIHGVYHGIPRESVQSGLMRKIDDGALASFHVSGNC